MKGQYEKVEDSVFSKKKKKNIRKRNCLMKSVLKLLVSIQTWNLNTVELLTMKKDLIINK